MKNEWLNNISADQEEEITELGGLIIYLETTDNLRPKINAKMLKDCKQELIELIGGIEEAEMFLENLRKVAKINVV